MTNQKQVLIDEILWEINSVWVDENLLTTKQSETIRKALKHFLPELPNEQVVEISKIKEIHEDLRWIPINCLDEIKYQDEFREIRKRIWELLD
jgi:hypothetical protein